MTIATLQHVTKGAASYDALVFWCPGCEQVDENGERQAGLHMLPINTAATSPSWSWNGSLDSPSLEPSILTRTNFSTGPDTPPREFICHSFLRNGQMEFLGDCTHQYASQTVPLPPLPEWALNL